MRANRRLPAALALSTLALLFACSEPHAPREWSVILVTLDTTRADRIGPYGGTAVPTPTLDRVAREGTVFEDAFSPVPLTLPAHASMFTGRYPATHGARHNGFYRLRDAELTLAEALQPAGYETAAFVGAFVLNRGFGVEQGFEEFGDVGDTVIGRGDPLNEGHRTADDVNAEVFEWLERSPQGPFFLWVHYYDPHTPWDPPERSGRSLAGSGYDREISYVDACLGDLVERLEHQGMLERSILVVVGDHGESLGEHREATHGVFLYDSTLRVPMIFRAPGLIPEGDRVGGPVSTVDLAPTILDLLGLPALPRAQGRSLVPRIEGRPARDDAVVFAESLMPRVEYGWSELRMARDERFKYVQAPREELYDLADDPGELHNLATIEVERTRRMAAQVEGWVRDTSVAGGGDAERDLSPEELERLRSLGYLGGDAVGQGDAAGSGIDPKDGLELSIRVEQARKLIRRGDRETAIPILEEVLGHDPANPLAGGMILKALVQLERFDAAERVALEAIDAGRSSRNASSTYLRQTRLRLAAIYDLQGKREIAERTYREALEGWVADDSSTAMTLQGLTTAVGPELALRVFEGLLQTEPDHPVALGGTMELSLRAGDLDAATDAAERILSSGAISKASGPLLVEAGRLLLDRGRAEPAATLFRAAIDRMGPQADLMGFLGTALLSLGRLDEAEQALEDARRLRPEDPRPHLYLGNIALLRDDEPRARLHYDHALDAEPSFTEPLGNLALWLAGQGRIDEARESLENALERNPEDAKARDLLGKLAASTASTP